MKMEAEARHQHQVCSADFCGCPLVRQLMIGTELPEQSDWQLKTACIRPLDGDYVPVVNKQGCVRMHVLCAVVSQVWDQRSSLLF